MMMIAVDDQVALSPDVPHPGHHVFFAVPNSPNFWEASTNWDGQWYRLIAERGYPDVLPRVNGTVAMNACAFYPLYAMLVRLVMSVSGSQFIVVAPLVSLAAALVGTLVLYRLIQHVSTRLLWLRSPYWPSTVTQPQLASKWHTPKDWHLGLLIVLGLKCIHDGRLGALVPVAVLLSLTRPIAIVLAVVVGVLLGFQIVQARRRHLPRPQVVKPFAAMAPMISSMALWPVGPPAPVGKTRREV